MSFGLLRDIDHSSCGDCLSMATIRAAIGMGLLQYGYYLHFGDSSLGQLQYHVLGLLRRDMEAPSDSHSHVA